MDLPTLLGFVPLAVSVLIYVTINGAFLVALKRWNRRRRRLGDIPRAPTVTILKPLAGADDELEENLASFARIDYPAFDILFGVASADDPAYPVARRFVAKHPELPARVVVTDPDNAVNPKVAQLVSLDRLARGEVVVISDSNVRVASTYLWSLVRELETEGTGLVTSAFTGTGERTIGAALENLQLGAQCGPGIVASTVLTRKPFTVGKSMAMRRKDLARLGGFARVGGVLAEDWVLGRLFLDAGFGVRTSLEVVENRNVHCSVRRTLERHTRWAKMRRVLAPGAFAFEPLLTPLVVATATALVTMSQAAWIAVLAVAVLQTACAFAALRALRGHGLRWFYAPLEIARSYLTLVCWLRACASRRIGWRGHAFVLQRGSAIQPAPRSSDSRILAAIRRLA